MNQYRQEGKRRRSIRLQDYDYSQNGAYFITICTHNRECFFGDIVADEMLLNEAGRMIESAWNDIPRRFPGVSLDASIVMPNHLHGIIVIEDAVGANLLCAQERCGRLQGGRIQDSPLQAGTLAGTVGRMVQAFKSITTNDYIVGVKQHGWPSFPGKIWHRDYYEHIIRSEKVLNATREYIVYNALRWALDPENPTRGRENTE